MNMHDLIWKLWAAKEMAEEICVREIYDYGGYFLLAPHNAQPEYKALAHILKKEWLR